MDQLELIQEFNQYPVIELLPYLYKVEKAINAIEPFLQNLVKIEVEQSTLISQKEAHAKTARSSKLFVTPLLIFGGVALLISMIFPGILTLLLGFLGFGSLCGGIVSLIANKSENSKAKKLEADIAALDSARNAAQVQLDRIKAENSSALYYLPIVCLEECRDPSIMRAYVRLFESGQATSLLDGKQKLSHYLHNLRMEQMAQRQLNAALSAEAAAVEAANAARNAASNASDAARHARRADYNTRYDD